MKPLNYLKVALLTVTLGCLGGCADESDLLKDSSTEKDALTSDEGLKAALESAEHLMSLIENKTRSANRKVNSVDYVVASARTRSESPDTLLYVINYSDNNGYAIVGTGELSNEVYAISPKGNISLSDTTNNIGLRVILSDIIKLTDIDRAYNEATAQNTIISPEGPVYFRYTTTETINPMVSEDFAHWVYGLKEFGSNYPQRVSSEAVAFLKIFSTLRNEASPFYKAFDWNFLCGLWGTDIADDIYPFALAPIEKGWVESGRDFNKYISDDRTAPIYDAPCSIYDDPKRIESLLKMSNHELMTIGEDGALAQPYNQPAMVVAEVRDEIKDKDQSLTAAFVVDGLCKVKSWREQNKKAFDVKNLCYYHCLFGSGIEYDGYYRFMSSSQYYNGFFRGATISNLGNLNKNLTVMSGIVFTEIVGL